MNLFNFFRYVNINREMDKGMIRLLNANFCFGELKTRHRTK